MATDVASIVLKYLSVYIFLSVTLQKAALRSDSVTRTDSNAKQINWMNNIYFVYMI